jgi:hypothetical protein
MQGTAIFGNQAFIAHHDQKPGSLGAPSFVLAIPLHHPTAYSGQI